jgi:hypothetical protein
VITLHKIIPCIAITSSKQIIGSILKNLLIFAHHNEAQIFIKNDSFKKFPELCTEQYNVYSSGSDFLAVIGEGITNTLVHLSIIFTHFKNNNIVITKAINMGVAGAIDSTLLLDSVYKVSQSYGEDEFKSFQTSHQLDRDALECLTTKKRIFNLKELGAQIHLASLVDRELWAIGFVCRSQNVKLTSYKVVSDFLGSDTEKLCETIHLQAENFSQKLYEFYKNQFLEVISVQKNQQDSLCSEESLKTLIKRGFYMGQTQKRTYKKLYNSLSSQFQNNSQIFEKLEVEQLLLLKKRPKELSSLLLKNMERLLNPLKDHIEMAVTDCLGPLQKGGWKITSDPQREEKQIEIKAKINDIKDYYKLSSSLKNFSLSNWNSIFDGNWDDQQNIH